MAMSAAHLSAALRTSLLTRDFVADNPALTEFCDSLAAAIVAEVALATITFTPLNAAGIQTSAAPGSPTAPPAAPVPVNGAIS
jgi:hypothetical protein